MHSFKLKRLPGFVGLCSIVFLVCSCSAPDTRIDQPDELASGDSPFDSVMAARLGADDYGMKVFVLALLKSGPNRSQDSTTRAELQKAHMANISRLVDEGKLVVAGPMMDDTDLKGIYVFDVTTVEEARALTETDPAIQAGSLVMELHPWYATAGLGELADIHDQIMRISF